MEIELSDYQGDVHDCELNLRASELELRDMEMKQVLFNKNVDYQFMLESPDVIFYEAGIPRYFAVLFRVPGTNNEYRIESRLLISHENL